MSAHQYDEGHTVAGWTGFAVATAGSVVLGLGVVMVSALVVAGGLAVVALSVLVTWALHLAGWGKPPGRRPREQWGWRTRDLSVREGHPGCVGCRLAGRGVREQGVAAPAAASVAGQVQPAPAVETSR